MKKWLLAIGALTLSFSLAACNSQDSSGSEKNKEEKNSKTHEKSASNTESEKYKFTNETGDFTILAGYTNEQSDKKEKYINIDFKGFKIKFLPVLVDVKLSDSAKAKDQFKGKDTLRAIMLTTEAENTTDHDVDYNGNITVITDTKEQLESQGGLVSDNPIVMTYKGKVKEQGSFLIPLKDQKSTPKELDLKFSPPYKVENGAVNPETGQMGNEQTIKVKYTPKESL
ncbi:hypothetical protein [Bacillus velezensis]|uniref:hypothetical protein n=1 Tax=Bacillus velezensis TaxID=492670 RepID=UPI000CC4F8A2|nr:hypothetical protein [Bacillus velezensis]PJN84889.1 hypothetical protein CV739_09105 [Bacillus velezensis]